METVGDFVVKTLKVKDAARLLGTGKEADEFANGLQYETPDAMLKLIKTSTEGPHEQLDDMDLSDFQSLADAVKAANSGFFGLLERRQQKLQEVATKNPQMQAMIEKIIASGMPQAGLSGKDTQDA